MCKVPDFPVRVSQFSFSLGDKAMANTYWLGESGDMVHFRVPDNLDPQPLYIAVHVFDQAGQEVKGICLLDPSEFEEPDDYQDVYTWQFLHHPKPALTALMIKWVGMIPDNDESEAAVIFIVEFN